MLLPSTVRYKEEEGKKRRKRWKGKFFFEEKKNTLYYGTKEWKHREREKEREYNKSLITKDLSLFDSLNYHVLVELRRKGKFYDIVCESMRIKV